MSYIYFPRNSILKQFVQYYWVLKSETICSEIIPPDPYYDLLFNYGDNSLWKSDDKQIRLKRSYLSGIRKKTYNIQSEGKTSYFAIRFYPNVLPFFFNIKVSEIADAPIMISDLNIKPLTNLEALLYEQNNIDNIITIVEKELLQLLMKNEHKYSDEIEIMNMLINLIVESNGNYKIDDLCKHSGMYYKKIERLFNNFIGTTPKYFMKLTRFSNTLINITNLGNNRNNKVDWADIAYESGYFDQAHFIKEFSTFLGMSPTTFYNRYCTSKELEKNLIF